MNTLTDWHMKGDRFICDVDHVMPKDAPGFWIHPDAKLIGGCREGCCDDYKCPHCGAQWRIEYDG